MRGRSQDGTFLSACPLNVCVGKGVNIAALVNEFTPGFAIGIRIDDIVDQACRSPGTKFSRGHLQGQPDKRPEPGLYQTIPPDMNC